MSGELTLGVARLDGSRVLLFPQLHECSASRSELRPFSEALHLLRRRNVHANREVLLASRVDLVEAIDESVQHVRVHLLQLLQFEDEVLAFGDEALAMDVCGRRQAVGVWMKRSPDYMSRRNCAQ